MRERFFGVLIAALIAVCLLAGAGAYLVNKIIYEANLDLNEEQENNLNNFKEPEVLAVSVASEESESEDLILSSEDANGDLDLNNLSYELFSTITEKSSCISCDFAIFKIFCS